MGWSSRDDAALRRARARVRYLEEKKSKSGCSTIIGGIIAVIVVGGLVFNDEKSSNPPKPKPAVQRSQSAASTKPQISESSQLPAQSIAPEAIDRNSDLSPRPSKNTVQNQSKIKVFSRVSGSISRVVSTNKVIFESNNGRDYEIQLLGVRPSQSKNLNTDARNYLQQLLKSCNSYVQLYSSNYEGGKSKGVTGKVICDNKDVGLELIKAGKVSLDTNNQGELTPSDQSLYRKAQNDAKNKKIGIWR